jgi:hypothetical protein
MSRSTYSAMLKYIPLPILELLSYIRQKVINVTKLMKKRAITPRWVIRFTSKLQGRQILTY